MKKLLIDLLSDNAMDDLKILESENKIRILNEDEVRHMNEKRDQIWKELEAYTYENIIKQVKENVG